MAVRIVIDEDATEDSLLAAMPLLQSEITKGLVDGKEDSIINADTNATHQDTGLSGWDTRARWGTANLGGTLDHRRAWLGLRARAFDTNATTDQSAAQTAAGFITALGNLDGPHFRDDVVCIVSPEYILKMLLFTETLTVDKYGTAATILTGEIAKLFGFPVVPSEFVDKEYNTTGVYDDATKTKTGFLLCNKSRFNMFQKRGARVRMQGDITRGIVNLVGDTRTLFDTFDGAAVKNVHWSYNLTP
jgi:hypothetical protein